MGLHLADLDPSHLPSRLAVTVTSLHDLHDRPRNRDTSTPHGVATAHFGQLRRPLLQFIDGSEIIVGCVAWLTERYILEALAARPVALVVQKENWWKKADARGKALAQRYAALTGGLSASAFPEPLATKTFRGKPVPNDAVLVPLACVGFGGASHHSPLMHHKFIVRCVMGPDGVLEPVAVWTGSQNFSANSDNSFENAVEIHDPRIAAAYLAEFALMASLSEPMNWRLSRPNPKGAGGEPFKPLPPKPKKTTTRVVKAAGKKRRATKKTTPAKKTAAKKAAPAKKAAAPKKRATKKTAAKKAAT